MTVQNKTLTYTADIKAIGDNEGEFEGYGSVFGNVDSYDEVVARGAFATSIAEKMPVMLWQHNWSMPIGVYTEAKEDDRGLFLKGKINLDVQQGREAYALLKQGAFKGLSIGYRVLADETDRTTGIRKLVKLDLMEVSLVTFPANDKANVERVKASAPDDIREFEKFLREGGYSQEAAKIIASKGFNALKTHREGGDVALVVSAFEGALNQLKKVTSEWSHKN